MFHFAFFRLIFSHVSFLNRSVHVVDYFMVYNFKYNGWALSTNTNSGMGSY